MRFYLTIILFFTAVCSAQSTRGRCGELILPISQQNPEYDASDYISVEAAYQIIRGDELIIHHESKSYSTKNQYQFSAYNSPYNNDHEKVRFIKILRGEEIIICPDEQCYKGIPVISYQKRNPTYQSAPQRYISEPCRGIDDSNECRPSRGH